MLPEPLPEIADSCRFPCKMDQMARYEEQCYAGQPLNISRQISVTWTLIYPRDSSGSELQRVDALEEFEIGTIRFRYDNMALILQTSMPDMALRGRPVTFEIHPKGLIVWYD